MLLAKARPWIAGVWWYDLFDDGDDAANKEHRFGLITSNGAAPAGVPDALQPARSTGGAVSDATAGQRNETLDIAKGLGIVLVVLGHNPVFPRRRASAI